MARKRRTDWRLRAEHLALVAAGVVLAFTLFSTNAAQRASAEQGLVGVWSVEERQSWDAATRQWVSASAEPAYIELRDGGPGCPTDKPGSAFVTLMPTRRCYIMQAGRLDLVGEGASGVVFQDWAIVSNVLTLRTTEWVGAPLRKSVTRVTAVPAGALDRDLWLSGQPELAADFAAWP